MKAYDCAQHGMLLAKWISYGLRHATNCGSVHTNNWEKTRVTAGTECKIILLLLVLQKWTVECCMMKARSFTEKHVTNSRKTCFL